MPPLLPFCKMRNARVQMPYLCNTRFQDGTRPRGQQACPTYHSWASSTMPAAMQALLASIYSHLLWETFISKRKKPGKIICGMKMPRVPLVGGISSHRPLGRDMCTAPSTLASEVHTTAVRCVAAIIGVEADEPQKLSNFLLYKQRNRRKHDNARSAATERQTFFTTSTNSRQILTTHLF